MMTPIDLSNLYMTIWGHGLMSGLSDPPSFIQTLGSLVTVALFLFPGTTTVWVAAGLTTDHNSTFDIMEP